MRKVFVLAALLGCNTVFAEGFWDQFKDPDDGQLDASDYLANNAYGFLPIPVIITDPAVEGGLGVVGIFFHETEEQKELRLKNLKNTEDGAQFLLTPSLSGVGVVATGNGSWAVGAGHMGFFKKGSIRYGGGLGYGDININFFGFGDIELDNPVEINTKAAVVAQSLKFRLGKSHFFAGFLQEYVNAQISLTDFGGLSGNFLPPEFQDEWEPQIRDLLSTDVTLSGLGVIVEYDSRDNLFSPHDGYRYQVEQVWFRDSIGSDIEYEHTKFNGLNYWQLTEKFRAALRLSADYAASDELLPPFALPFIELRGIPAMRYQGNYVVVAETELTWQINPRWALIGFAGSGRAAKNSSELKDSPSRVTKGAGFRYLIAKRYGFEMGLDIAVGPEENVFYIQAGTAWK